MFNQKEFNKALTDVIDSMIFLANKEELKIGKFIGITQKSSYKLVQSIKWVSYFLMILIIIIISILNLEWEWVENIIILIFFIFLQIGIKYIGYSYSFYSVVRSRFNKYQKQLKLITQNSHFHNFIQNNEELKMKNDLVNQKFNYVLKVLKTPLDYIKTFEILGVLGLLVSILIPLFQDLLSSIVISNYLFDILGIVLFILFLYLSPVLIYNKSAGFKEYRKSLREKLKKLRDIQRLNLIEKISESN